jgi:hypothetical protein
VFSLQRTWPRVSGLSASDSEELEHTLLATDNPAKTDIHVNPGDTDRYESLVVQRVLSTQVTPAEKN